MGLRVGLRNILLHWTWCCILRLPVACTGTTLVMLDINDLITERGGNPEKVRESQRRRNAPVEIVDEVIAMFEDHKKTSYEAMQIGTKINTIQKEIGAKKKAKENADDLLQQKNDLTEQKKKQEDLAAEKQTALSKKLKSIGNYVHDSVPFSVTEDDNAVIRTWAPEGVTPEKKDCLSHHEVLTRLDGYDPARATKIAGHRGYCLTGWGVFLNLAMIQYGLEFLHGKGYQPNQPPFFMNRGAMAKTAQLEEFDEALYKVTEDDNKDNDKYLIATSEQPLSCLHEAEWLTDKDLPIRYVHKPPPLRID